MCKVYMFVHKKKETQMKMIVLNGGPFKYYSTLFLC